MKATVDTVFAVAFSSKAAKSSFSLSKMFVTRTILTVVGAGVVAGPSVAERAVAPCGDLAKRQQMRLLNLPVIRNILETLAELLNGAVGNSVSLIQRSY